MGADFRETTVWFQGSPTLVRTERTARMTVARLESDHFKAVRAALEKVALAAEERLHADVMAEHLKNLGTTSGNYRRDYYERELKRHTKAMRRFRKPGWTSKGYSPDEVRKGFPPVRYTVDPQKIVDDYDDVTYEEI